MTSDPVAVGQVAHLPEGSLRLVRAGGRRLCLISTSTGIYAIDNACPHEGYGLTQGDLDGDVLTCAWHNWKFQVSDGACVLGEEDVRAHPVTIDADGTVSVQLSEPEPAETRLKLMASLRRGIERDYVGQISRDVVRLLQASANPGELVWEAVNHGAPRGELGWGHSVASATDCLAMTELYDGDARALPIVQAIAGIAEEERDRRVWTLPEPAPALPGDPKSAFRHLVEAEDLGGAQALVLAGIDGGLGPDELRAWVTAAVSDHHLSYGHGAIYAQKAFQLLDLIGWDRAPCVLPHLLPGIVHGTREDRLPYMRPFMKALAGVDLAALSEVAPDPTWRDDGTLRAALLGRDKVAPVTAAVAALHDGAGANGLVDAAVGAVSERLLRYDIDGERDFEDDFGWLDITHGLTYANAARWHHRHDPSPDTLRLTLFCLFLAHWTGRHEWHTAVREPSDSVSGESDLVAACAEHRPEDAVAAALSLPLADAGRDLQRAALLDGTSAFIVHAHAVKMARAAAEEAAMTASALPIAAAARFIAAPKLERFVAATVTRSIAFLNGRAPRD